MVATRTQIYLSEDQRQRIDQVSAAEGVPMAEVIRRALDRYLSESTIDASTTLLKTFGADPEARVPTRDEWDRG